MSNQEQWRDVPGYEGLYQVSDRGRVKSLIRRGRIMRNQPTDRGYMRVYLRKNGTAKHERVHVLVAAAFIGARPDHHHVDHINSNRADNQLDNLRYLHYSQNLAQGQKKHPKYAEDNPNSKLTNAQRREIVTLAATGKYTQKEIGAMFGIKRSSVGSIVSGQNGSVATGIVHRRVLEAQS